VPRIAPHHVVAPVLDDPAQVHDRDPVRDLADHGQVVGDQDEPEVGVVHELAEQVGDLSLGRGVQGADRLVCDQAGRRVTRVLAMAIRCRWPPLNSCG